MQLTLAELRKNAGYTQQGAAKALGVSRVAIADWERGVYQPAPEHRPRLAKLYRTTGDNIAFALRRE